MAFLRRCMVECFSSPAHPGQRGACGVMADVVHRRGCLGNQHRRVHCARSDYMVPGCGSAGLASLAVVAGHCSLFRHGAALVHRCAASESHFLPRIFPRAQPAAFCHRPLSAQPADLVLPGGDAAGAYALDGAGSACAHRWHSHLGGGVEVALFTRRQMSAHAARRRLS